MQDANDRQKKDFSRRLRQRLVEKGINQSELARRIFGVVKTDSRNYGYAAGKDNVSRWCNGKIFPSALLLKKLTDVLECEATDLAPWLFDDLETGVVEVSAPKRAPGSTTKRSSAGLEEDICELLINPTNPDEAQIKINKTITPELGLQIMRLIRDAENLTK